MTGTVGRWGIGVLAADDRAPAKQAAADDPMSDVRALAGVFRVEREFGRQSHVGALATSLAWALVGCDYAPSFQHTRCATSGPQACPSGYVCDQSLGPPGMCLPAPDAGVDHIGASGGVSGKGGGSAGAGVTGTGGAGPVAGRGGDAGAPVGGAHGSGGLGAAGGGRQDEGGAGGRSEPPGGTAGTSGSGPATGGAGGKITSGGSGGATTGTASGAPGARAVSRGAVA